MASRWTIFDWISNWRAPAWIRIILQQLNDLMMAILTQACQEYVSFIKGKIVEAAAHPEWTPEAKFAFVYSAAKNGLKTYGVALKDNEINTIINYFVSRFKKDGAI